jgi:hypothetical protein
MPWMDLTAVTPQMAKLEMIQPLTLSTLILQLAVTKGNSSVVCTHQRKSSLPPMAKQRTTCQLHTLAVNATSL